MKCLVTGGCGFIGSHIVDKLIDEGSTVVVVDDLSAPENENFYFNSNAVYHKKDISKDDCAELFDGVDFVFHLAARSRIQPTIGAPNECFEVNVVGTQRVLEWSRANNIQRVVYSGTSSLYGKQNTAPFNPNMPADCLNPYSMSKWMGEQVCKLYSQLYELDVTILRYFNVYGTREPTKGEYAPVVGLFKRQFNSGAPMTIVGDGSQRRDFTHVDDVVNANLCAIKNSPHSYKIYNVGTGKNYSIKEITSMIGGPNARIEYIPSRLAEVKETLADISETVSDLKWEPKKTLHNVIMSY